MTLQEIEEKIELYDQIAQGERELAFETDMYNWPTNKYTEALEQRDYWGKKRTDWEKEQMVSDLDINQFRANFEFIECKLDKIAQLDPDGYGQDYIGLTIDPDEDTIYYNTETYFQGCGDTYSFSTGVKWEELNQPLSYFKEKFEREAREEQERKEAAEKAKREKARVEKQEQELRTLARLMKKYPDA